MPGFRKYGKRRSKPKMSVRRRPAGTTSVAALAKTVARLVKRDKVQTQVIQLRDNQVYDTVTTPVQLHCLSAYSRMVNLWPSTNNNLASSRDKARHRSIVLDNLITLDNTGLAKEYSTINFTYIVFSPKDARGAFTSETPTLTADVDYSIASGKALMNMNAYKIWYAKRFTLTQNDATNGDATHMQRRFIVKLRPNKLVKAVDDNWKDLTMDPDPSNQLFVALFNDNSSLDGQYPRWELAAVHTFEQ